MSGEQSPASYSSHDGFTTVSLELAERESVFVVFRHAAAAPSRAEAMKPQSMGTALAQMEEEGLVRRKAHPTDGRQILYELTPAGVEGRYKSRLAKRAWLLAAINRLGRDEQQKLFAATDVIKRLAET